MVFRRLKFPVYKSFKVQQLDSWRDVKNLIMLHPFWDLYIGCLFSIELNIKSYYLSKIILHHLIWRTFSTRILLSEDLDRETNSSFRFPEPVWKKGAIEPLKWLAPLCGIISWPKLKWLPLYLSLNLLSKLICLSLLLTCNFILFLLSLSDYWLCLFFVYLYCNYCTALWSAGGR